MTYNEPVYVLIDPIAPAEPAKPDTTYTITMAMSTATFSSAVHYDLTAYEYNEAGEKVANNALNMAVNGSTMTFSANPRAVKVKLYIKMYSDNSDVWPNTFGASRSSI